MKNIFVIALQMLQINSIASEHKWEISGVDSVYKQCDSLTFTLQSEGDTSEVCVIIGLEKEHDGVWGTFIRNIDQEDETQPDIVYCFNTERQSTNIIWHPYKSTWYSHRKLRKRLRGSFRFIFIEYSVNSTVTKKFYSDTFQIR